MLITRAKFPTTSRASRAFGDTFNDTGVRRARARRALIVCPLLRAKPTAWTEFEASCCRYCCRYVLEWVTSFANANHKLWTQPFCDYWIIFWPFKIL